MNKAYPDRINWINEPSTATPINEDNLNLMDGAIDVIDDRVVTLDSRVNNLQNYETRASQAATNSENSANASAASATLSNSWAVGNTGTRVGENTNNSKYWSQQSENSNQSSLGHAIDSEAWAVGKRSGADVSASDVTYHNNSKYYAERAEESVTNGGYISMEIDPDGDLIVHKTHKVDTINFAIVDNEDLEVRISG